MRRYNFGSRNKAALLTVKFAGQTCGLYVHVPRTNATVSKADTLFNCVNSFCQLLHFKEGWRKIIRYACFIKTAYYPRGSLHIT